MVVALKNAAAPRSRIVNRAPDTVSEVVPVSNRRQAGLWFSTLSIKAEPVKKAHKLPCSAPDCGIMPQVGTLRLVLKKGGGRRSVKAVFCTHCGVEIARRMEEESRRLVDHLHNGFTQVRLPGDMFPPKAKPGDEEES